jgi:hypothetical protein
MRYIIRDQAGMTDYWEGDLALRQVKRICTVIPYLTRLEAGEMMKTMIFAVLALTMSVTALAQDVTDDGSRVVLPIDLQSCKVPNAPPPIPENAAKEDLLKAKKLITEFQGEMLVYRTCMGVETEEKIDGLAEKSGLSEGNVMAILSAYDYSVTKEEQVATAFNEALRAYKASLAK